MKIARVLLIVLTAAACASHATAQQHGTAHQGHGAAPAPYAGMDTRPIKSLSDQQISDLRAGRGMGLALAAELNGYPGPVHVLEHATALELSEEQRAAMQGLVAALRAETTPIGEAVIAAETELERSFRLASITPASLQGATAAIADLQGELRAAHLKYHLTTVETLTPEQVRRYNELRGYSGSGSTRHR